MKLLPALIVLILVLALIWLPMLLPPTMGISPEALPVGGDTFIVLNAAASAGAVILFVLYLRIRRRRR